jgi:transcriptional regulator with XRE-family HTH domain
MKWNGEKITGILEQRHINVSSLAKAVGVTRPTIYAWIKGKVPKGHDLLQLCNYFDLGAESFFDDSDRSLISITAHRTHKNVETTDDKRDAAHVLASEYLLFFKQAQPFGIVQSLPNISNAAEYIQTLASQVRRLSGIPDGKPMTYECALELLNQLGIFAVFREFPKEIKSYAFYCTICNHRVVFVNTKTNVLDLIFQLVHEAIHAIRTNQVLGVPDSDEEKFCDEIACRVQFPYDYIKQVATAIREDKPSNVIFKLKEFARTNGHSIYGLTKAFQCHKENAPHPGINVNPADAILKKGFPTVYDILFEKEDARFFIERLSQFSPHFVRELRTQLSGISIRKLGQLLGLDTSIDAQAAKEELARTSSVK